MQKNRSDEKKPGQKNRTQKNQSEDVKKRIG
jgi:hypothetical protein